MDTLGLQEAARFLRISTDALKRKARTGMVPGARIGRQWVFLRDDLAALIRKQAKEREGQTPYYALAAALGILGYLATVRAAEGPRTPLRGQRKGRHHG